MTLSQALAAAADLGLDRLDAQLLLLHALGRPQTERAWLLAHDRDRIDPDEQAQYELFCARRRAGEPLAYIVGQKEFFGLQLHVDARVLVPRPATETLVEWALEVLDAVPGPAPTVADLGTGSGAIALAIKKHRPQAAVTAIDASAGALAVARKNAEALSLHITLRQGSWLTATSDRYDLIVSNPPYVADADPHLAALTHEPLCALAAGPDGLVDVRAIAHQGLAHLKPDGWLLLEHGWDQAGAARVLLQAAGMVNVASRRDLAGIERCSGGQRVELG